MIFNVTKIYIFYFSISNIKNYNYERIRKLYNERKEKITKLRTDIDYLINYNILVI